MEVTTTATTTFQDLPADIRKNYLIFFLDISSFLNLSCVSKEYNSLIKDLKFWYPHFQKYQSKLETLSWSIGTILSRSLLPISTSHRNHYLMMDLITNNNIWYSGSSKAKNLLFQLLIHLPYLQLSKLSKIYPIFDVEYDVHTIVEINVTLDLNRDGGSNVLLSFNQGGQLTELQILVYFDTIGENRVIFKMIPTQPLDKMKPSLLKVLPFFQTLTFPDGMSSNFDSLNESMKTTLFLSESTYKFYD